MEWRGIFDRYVQCNNTVGQAVEMIQKWSPLCRKWFEVRSQAFIQQYEALPCNWLRGCCVIYFIKNIMRQHGPLAELTISAVQDLSVSYPAARCCDLSCRVLRPVTSNEHWRRSVPHVRSFYATTFAAHG